MLRAIHHVRVGEDVSARVHHKAGAYGSLPADDHAGIATFPFVHRALTRYQDLHYARSDFADQPITRLIPLAQGVGRGLCPRRPSRARSQHGKRQANGRCRPSFHADSSPGCSGLDIARPAEVSFNSFPRHPSPNFCYRERPQVSYALTASSNPPAEVPACRDCRPEKTFGSKTIARAKSIGSVGGRTFPSANGARCARTTARTEPPGSFFRTITRDRGPIAGARMELPGSATGTRSSAWPWRCGMG